MMPKTVVGLFDTFNEAQECVRDLESNGFTNSDISVVASEEAQKLDTGTIDTSAGNVGSGAAAGAAIGAVGGGAIGLLASLGLFAIPGLGPILAAGPLVAFLTGAGIGAAAGGIIGALTGMGIPEEEAGLYAEGVRRGGSLVTVQTASDELANRAVDIMNRHDVVDIDERGEAYRQEGYTGYQAGARPFSAEEIRRERARFTQATPAVASSATMTREAVQSQAPRENFQDGEARLPVVEENLEVGKRTVQTGGVRVKTYVTERPVQEQVNLREEHVNVERRPVDRPASEADFHAFKEGTIEVTETAEKPVVSKEARVVEEVVVDKGVQERTETVQDTVRRTDVDVQNIGATGAAGTAARRSFDDFEEDFRSNWQSSFATTGSYETYRPAYRYGYDLRSNAQYANRDWTEVEADARRDWESRQPGTWERFKDSIRYAWDRDRGETGSAAGTTAEGTGDTRSLMEKAADAVTGDEYDDKTGRRVA
jgi:uncharacterized protein (TIGR02271 family)